MFICDVSGDEVNKVVEKLSSKHKDSKVGGCVLDVREGSQWDSAWKVKLDNLKASGNLL